MKVRDRLVVAVLAAALVAGAMWVLLVSPERGQVTSLSSQIATERLSLLSAQGRLASSRRAASGYVGHVHQIDTVLRSVPPSPAEAALIQTIVRLAGTKVDFHQLDVGSGAATTAGPVSLGLTFTFSTTYGDLQNFLAALDALTTTDGSNVSSSDRLFTISSVSLTPVPPYGTKATVSAQVYVQGGAAAAAGATGATGAASPTAAPLTAATGTVTG
jgi:Tfp pilus assembly protein PilO